MERDSTILGVDSSKDSGPGARREVAQAGAAPVRIDGTKAAARVQAPAGAKNVEVTVNVEAVADRAAPVAEPEACSVRWE